MLQDIGGNSSKMIPQEKSPYKFKIFITSGANLESRLKQINSHGVRYNETNVIISSGYVENNRIKDNVNNPHLLLFQQNGDSSIMTISTPISLKQKLDSYDYNNAQIYLNNVSQWKDSDFENLYYDLINYVKIVHSEYDGVHMIRIANSVVNLIRLLDTHILESNIETNESDFFKLFQQRKERIFDYRKYKHRMYVSALVHDLGKVLIPSWILNKKSNLTSEEFELMKRHTQFGGEILKCISPQLKFEILGASKHHLRVDGNGYNGKDRLTLNETEIVDINLLYLADVYDALRQKRSYKNAFSFEKTRDIIIKNKQSENRLPFKGSIHPGLYNFIVRNIEKIEKVLYIPPEEN